MLLDAFFFIKFPMILLVNLVLGQKLELLEQAAPVDKMNRILCSEARASGPHIVHLGLPALILPALIKSS